MNLEIASQIAEFLNNYNKLDIILTPKDILKDAINYIYILDNNEKLIGVVKLLKLDWYLGIIKHLSVHPQFRKNGYGTKLLNMAEKRALTQKVRVLQATIKYLDNAGINCFKKSGYKQVNCFFNNRTSRKILIFQKILVPC
ncbi:MAG: GNAT family N-acetyltransferase [Candidatus Helarchaeota archaeon]